ncbi:ATP-binding protein [Kitasatospora sp. LaBMicrA B282]|uniref:ATP-binding protein n=1 Tax=Kitasatospora sp. LaBMicrA B282 TaxID=3420949 RepID=UPI003D0E87B8
MSSEITLAHLADTALCAGWQFPSSKRGARLARLAAECQLSTWGWKPTAEVFQNSALIIAELASNAVTHGRVPGRGFQLRLLLGPCPGLATLLRIEVSDLRGDRLPRLPDDPTLGAERGRGLLLVDALADRWGTVARVPSAKTLWAELDLMPRQQN